jgi:hypothetical protein
VNGAALAASGQNSASQAKIADKKNLVAAST